MLGAPHTPNFLSVFFFFAGPALGQNGYYKWEPTEKAYIKSAQAPAGAWRVPNVYDLVSTCCRACFVSCQAPQRDSCCRAMW